MCRNWRTVEGVVDSGPYTRGFRRSGRTNRTGVAFGARSRKVRIDRRIGLNGFPDVAGSGEKTT